MEGGLEGKAAEEESVQKKKNRWVQQCSIDYLQYCLEISEFIVSIDNILTVFF